MSVYLFAFLRKHNFQPHTSQLGTPLPAKMDEFSEKLRKGGGKCSGVHFPSKKYHFKFGADPTRISVMNF